MRAVTIVLILIILLLLIVDNKLLTDRVALLEQTVSQMQNAHE